MASLSGVFYALSNRLATPGTYEVRELCENAFKTYCTSCRQSGLCWGQDYDRTADLLNKLADAVARHGTADAFFIPADFLARCPYAPKALSEIHVRHARLLEQAARQNKTEVFALDYEAIAALLTEASEENAEALKPDVGCTAAARLTAAKLNLSGGSAVVYGTRRKTLVAGGIELSSLHHTAEELRVAFSEACGLSLTLPEFRLEDRYVTMTAFSAPVIACESARASLRKADETANGDSAAIFENADGFYYALISDGMGSGADAAITSRITCIFLEKLLSAGNRKPTVLKMLNHVIRHKNLECFATVDLLEIDRLSGEASFIKSGAAASYILREGKLFKLESASLPIGITREMAAEEIRFSLLPGDLIVMISDGVSQRFEDGVWLLSLLSEDIDPTAPLSYLAHRILDEAKRKNQRSDDMTVELIRIAEETDTVKKKAPAPSTR
jgi:stage II sporulation protein E